MKKNLLFVFLLCSSFFSDSQVISPQRYPTRQVGWTINESLNNPLKTSDGGIVGLSNNQTRKYSEAGILQFSLPFTYSTLLPTSDGGYIMGVIGSSAQTSLNNYYGGADTWIVKINAAGIIQWQKSLSGTGDDVLVNMKLNANGDLIVLLSSNSTDNFGVGNQGGKDLWLVHLSSIGTLTKINLGGSADETFKNLETISSTESLVCLTTTSQNGVFNQGFKGGIDTWVLKITKGVSLSITQKRAYGGFADDEANLTISNNKYLLSGYSKSNSGDLSVNRGLKDIWICFINTDGTLISSDNYGGAGDDFARDTYFNTIDNTFYILGENSSTDGDFPNATTGIIEERLFKFNTTGGFLWRRDFYVQRPFDNSNSCKMIKFPNESGIFITGRTSNSNFTNLFIKPSGFPTNYNYFSFICKLNSNDGATSWYNVPINYDPNRPLTFDVLEKDSEGNILCYLLAPSNIYAVSKLFSINFQGNEVKTNYEYPCPDFSFPNNSHLYCQPASLTAISGNNGVIFTQYYSSSYYTRKVCPQVYAGITRGYRLYCSTTISDTIRVPDDNNFTYQWKRNGSVIGGATLPKYLATQTGKYTVEISGKTCSGKAETDTIVLDLATYQTVIPKLKATTDSTVCLGDTVKMNVADGCNYSFLQWQKNGVDIIGETSLNFRTTTSGVYRVKVTTSGVASYTNAKTVTINTNCCIMKSIANGSWESPSTWSCNRVPAITDNVTIDGHQINVTTNAAKAKKVIYQGGKINMANSTAKLLIQNN